MRRGCVGLNATACTDRPACCDPAGPASKAVNLGGSRRVGFLSVFGGLLAFLVEDPTRGFGLWMPTDWPFYALRVAPQAVLLGILGLVALTARATCLAGFFALMAAACYEYAFWRQEAGDGGRARRKNARKKNPPEGGRWSRLLASCGGGASFAWVVIYLAVNALIMMHTLYVWIEVIRDLEEDLLRDTLKLDGCDRCPAAKDAPSPWPRGRRLVAVAGRSRRG